MLWSGGGNSSPTYELLIVCTEFLLYVGSGSTSILAAFCRTCEYCDICDGVSNGGRVNWLCAVWFSGIWYAGVFVSILAMFEESFVIQPAWEPSFLGVGKESVWDRSGLVRSSLKPGGGNNRDGSATLDAFVIFDVSIPSLERNFSVFLDFVDFDADEVFVKVPPLLRPLVFSDLLFGLDTTFWALFLISVSGDFTFSFVNSIVNVPGVAVNVLLVLAEIAFDFSLFAGDFGFEIFCNGVMAHCAESRFSAVFDLIFSLRSTDFSFLFALPLPCGLPVTSLISFFGCGSVDTTKVVFGSWTTTCSSSPWLELCWLEFALTICSSSCSILFLNDVALTEFLVVLFKSTCSMDWETDAAISLSYETISGKSFGKLSSTDRSPRLESSPEVVEALSISSEFRLVTAWILDGIGSVLRRSRSSVISLIGETFKAVESIIPLAAAQRQPSLVGKSPLLSSDLLEKSNFPNIASLILTLSLTGDLLLL